jgi:predicted DNA-binding transcriptional regulator AlpA
MASEEPRPSPPDDRDDQLIDVEEVARICSVAPPTVYRMVRRGDLPPPIRFNQRLQRWFRSDVLAAIRSRPPAA